MLKELQSEVIAPTIGHPDRNAKPCCRDLLNRHLATHRLGDRLVERCSTRRGRATKACSRCISAKTKCSDERPCQRCRERGEICDPDSHDCPSSPSSSLLQPTNVPRGSSDQASLQEAYGSNRGDAGDSMLTTTSWNQTMSVANDHLPMPSSAEMPLGGTQPSFEWLAPDGGGFPSMWDSNFMSSDSMFSIDDDTLMAMSLDWNSLIEPERSLQSRNVDQPSSAQPAATSASANRTRSCVLSGHEAFKRSVWLWDPDPRDSASLEEPPQLSEAEERSILSPGGDGGSRSLGFSLHIRLTFKSENRDALLLLVQQNSDHAVVIRSFPSPEALGFLLKIFVVHESISPCSFVHIPSLVVEGCRTELLSAFVVAGSASSANHQVWKFGMALQERTRLALYKAFDHDNSIARNLDTIQAQLLWIEAGLWSGYRRKMEVAESPRTMFPR